MGLVRGGGGGGGGGGEWGGGLSQGLSFPENSNVSHKSHGPKHPRINVFVFTFNCIMFVLNRGWTPKE